MPDHTPYQKGVIRRYYEHRDTLALQKLGEIVGNLYLETSEAKLGRLWRSAHKQLLAAGMHAHEAEAIVSDRDLGLLAKRVGELA